LGLQYTPSPRIRVAHYWPTADLRAVLKGVLKDHLRAAERVLAQNVFPGSDGVKPVARSVG
jgi:uncharacterized protein (DUF1501 family)